MPTLIHNLDPDTDYPALIELGRAIDAVDHAGLIASEEELRSQPQRQRWVLPHPDDAARLIGHGWIAPQSDTRCYIYVSVHPDERRKGLGSKLLAYGVQLATEKGLRQIVAFANFTDRRADAFIHHNGFRVAGRNRYLSVPEGFEPDAPQWPAGYTVRSLAELHAAGQPGLATVVQAFNLCYSDLWGHSENTEPLTEEKLTEWMQIYPLYFLSEALFFAFAPDGSLAGLSSGRLEELEPAGEMQPVQYRLMVDAPAAAPAHRHAGLLRPLVLHTMRWLRTRGAGVIELHTFGDFDENIKLYQEIGFTLKDEDHWVEYLLEKGK